ncbi:MAG: phosphoglycerate dehydrogenase [Eubacteriales bacterium]|nr:phosphoglycerate dehydrogenase [Eubacteriales bacterium]
MYKIQTLNKIAECGLKKFGSNYEIGDNVQNPDGIILRSFNMHEMEIPESVLGVARAGAGVNNIPVDACAEKGIVVFNTPGANANAVKELTICALLLASRKIAQGIDWAKTLTGDDVDKQVEKGKSQFVGPEISGKTLGVVGLGAIGVLVANAAEKLGMEVIGYDPYLSIEAAWDLSSKVCKASSLDEIYANCDYITMHLPLLPATKDMINAEAIEKMKDGVRIVNLARGGLVNTPDIIAATESGKVASYVADFITGELVGKDNIIAIPHLGASTPESEDNCAMMAAEELREYIEKGNIINSVNFPKCESEITSAKRVCIIHKNKPNMISQFSSALASEGINIDHFLNKSKGDNAYTMIDTEVVIESAIEKIKAIDGVIRLRVIG